MEYIIIYAKSGYKPRPEYKIKITASGELRYRGIYYVSNPGEEKFFLDDEKLDKAMYLADLLLQRNKRFYLSDIEDEKFVVRFRKNGKVSEFSIDSSDPVSADLVDQINTVTGVSRLIKAPLYIWQVFNRSENRSKELAILSAQNKKQALEIYFKSGNFNSDKEMANWNLLKMGQKLELGHTSPEIYFSYRENQILKDLPELYVNVGPEISDFTNLNFYLYVSFGKRFNDPKASYILTLAADANQSKKIISETFPHLMEKDYQMTDLKARFIGEGDLYSHHIPLALR
ncbi:hypothetical protein [Membranihabitans maritimus]|uniref:hypothetical protein n=1 Tax=Membranihabitans maritimus TaxID=2904244 RepID=UPI001F3A3CDE|nr:hypothetical protein [Membranihabitans maritimus]